MRVETELGHALRIERSKQQRLLRTHRSQQAPTRATKFWRRVFLLDIPDLQGKLARNERRKLLSTFCNNVGVALMVTAYVTPLISILTKAFEQDAEKALGFYMQLLFQKPTLVVMICGVLGGTLCHSLGLAVLRGLED
ncbi:hypothetical protein [Bradyrhizobium japonicum]|uniref:hypothetical protein n=1 Tax=Bradyrhizobium japonicum TaxID=375 RepID=UPI001BABBAC0|nr:hypothetical protein [Bradyrhizobium japonicum]MBR0962236.1 hypothetical protein [Bradyrhizobium japonicum]